MHTHTQKGQPTSGRLLVRPWGSGRTLWCSGLRRQGSSLSLLAGVWGRGVGRDGDYRCCCYWGRRVASVDLHLGGRGGHCRGSMGMDQLGGYVLVGVRVPLGRDTLSNMVHWSCGKTTAPWWLWPSFSNIWREEGTKKTMLKWPKIKALANRNTLLLKWSLVQIYHSVLNDWFILPIKNIHARMCMFHLIKKGFLKLTRHQVMSPFLSGSISMTKHGFCWTWH